MGPPSKRKRTVTSCSQCRKKKVKCDKGRPQCKVCVAAGKGNMCEYQEPSWNEDIRSKVADDYTLAANVPLAHITLNSASTLGSTPKPKVKQTKSNDTKPGSAGSVMGLESTFSVQPSSTDYSQGKHEHPQMYHPSQSIGSPLSSMATSYNNYQQMLDFPHQQGQQRTSLPFPQPNIGRPSIASTTSPIHDVAPQHNESNIRGGILPPLAATPDTPGSISSQTQGDTMTFYDFYEPVFVRAGRLVASGPLSLASIIKKDPFLRVTLLKIRKEKKNLNMYSFQTKALNTKDLVKQIIVDQQHTEGKDVNTNAKVEEAFQTRLLENEALDEVKGASAERRDTQVFGQPRVDYETETIMKIGEVLPNQKLLWLLFDRFMGSPLAAFMPFINEPFLSEKLQDIIGKRSSEEVKVKSIRISRRFDFAYIGVLLIVLRISFLTVSKTLSNTDEEKYILANPIGMNVVNVAQMCLNQFRLLRRGAIPLLQCALFMRYYHKLAPEDGDGSDGGDSEVFLGMLLQMANSIGLNRDLSHVHLLQTNQRLSNVWRFIWYEIVTLDLYQSLTRGNPILVDENSFDTKIPIWSEEANITTHKDVRKASIKNCEMGDVINNLVRPILRDILNISKPVRVRELMTKVARLEIHIDGNFKSLGYILNLPSGNTTESVEKIFKMKNYIELKTALYSIYFHIYLNNPQSNYTILHKMVTIVMELAPMSYFLSTINNGKTNYFDTIFGSGAQLMLVPVILTSLHKIAQLLIAFISRSLDIKYNYPDFEYMATITAIREGLVESYGLVRDSFQSLSSVYYHAWKGYKSIAYLGKLLSDEANNIWDKSSEMNEECKSGQVEPDVDHFKAIPQVNELAQLSEYQLDQLLALVTTKRFEQPVLQRLNTKSKKTSKATSPPMSAPKSYPHMPGGISVYDTTGSTGMSGTQSELSGGSTPPNNGFHTNKNVMSNVEIDRLWFQMMASNTSKNIQEGDAVNGAVGNVLSNALDDSAAGDDNVESTIPSRHNNTSGGGINSGNSGNVHGHGHGGGNGTFDPSVYGGVFGTLDFEKLIGDASPYDMFDIPFYQDS
ncbi:CYFA0S01e06810g1_1 [Cyberlindnera fabianii]|nr:CYFA0S01e06810g1_1 [Cyberlindnera fabianii]